MNNQILFRSLYLRVAKSYDEDFLLDKTIKAYHLAKLESHYRLTLKRFNGLFGPDIEREVILFLTEVQNIVDTRDGSLE